MDLKTVFRAFNSAEAQLVRSQLEAAEFTVFVGDADHLAGGNVLVCAGGVRPHLSLLGGYQGVCPGMQKVFWR